MSNYAIYPMKYIHIVQNHKGITSHLPHNTGTPKDYPVDDGGHDYGRDWVFCPCDEMKVIRIYGVGNSGTNTIWLTSTKKVNFADGTSDYLTGMFIHSNDDDLSKIKVGQKFSRLQAMFREGTDGASANHIHFAFGKGKVKGNGWEKNTSGKWVLTTTGGCFPVDKLLYIDRAFTKIEKDGGYVFKNMPTKKSTKEIAKEVIDGKWGNGAERKKRLKAAGYTDKEIKEIQKYVNRLVEK